VLELQLKAILCLHGAGRCVFFGETVDITTISIASNAAFVFAILIQAGKQFI
jgi:hypothetical protein